VFDEGPGYVLPPELDGGYALTFRRLRRYFQSRGVLREEAADLAQEAIARSLLHLNRWGGHQGYDGIGPLLNRIASNLLIDRARSSGPRLVSIESAEHLDDASQDPSEEVARLHEHRAVRTAISQLSSRHRHALLLTLDGMTPAEIAERLGIRRNAADALLHRARRRLAENLRVTSDVAFGFVAMIGIRVRAAARRAAEAGRSVGAFATGPAMLNAATFALAAAVAVPVAGALDSDGARAMPGAPAVAAADVAGVRAPGSSVGARDRANADAQAAGIDTRAHSGEVGTRWTNPVTGEEHHTRAGFYHDRADGDRGVTGPLLDTVTQTACDDVAPLACEGLQP
jgi:RNA polymerase sigma-70 factor (ECF subfamily)